MFSHVQADTSEGHRKKEQQVIWNPCSSAIPSNYSTIAQQYIVLFYVSFLLYKHTHTYLSLFTHGTPITAGLVPLQYRSTINGATFRTLYVVATSI